MTEYALSYQLSPDMLGRAMLSWARPHYNRAAWFRRAGLFIGACLTIGAFIALVRRYEIVTDAFLLGGLVGFYLAIGLWMIIQRQSTRKLVGLSQAALARQGAVNAVFTADHVALTTAISSGTMGWRCFDDISALPDATVLRAGGVVYAVPDAALSAGVTPHAFRDQLTQWQEASRCNNP